MIVGQIRRRRRLRKLSRIFGNQFPQGIDKDGRFRIGYFLDTVPLTVVIVPANRRAIFLYFRLLVVAVKDELTRQGTGRRIDVGNYVSVVVVAKALICSKTICSWINRRCLGLSLLPDGLTER